MQLISCTKSMLIKMPPNFKPHQPKIDDARLLDRRKYILVNKNKRRRRIRMTNHKNRCTSFLHLRGVVTEGMTSQGSLLTYWLETALIIQLCNIAELWYSHSYRNFKSAYSLNTPRQRRCSNIAEQLCAEDLLKVPTHCSSCLRPGSNP